MCRVNRRAVGAVVLACAVALGGCANPPPAEFLSRAHKFRVQFGAVPPRVSERAVGGTRSVVYAVEDARGARSVTVIDLPVKGDEPPEFAPWALDSAKNDLIRAAGGTETSVASLTLAGKYPGRDFAATTAHPNPGRMRARVYLVGPRLYQVMLIGTDDYVASDDATAFLDSFRLTD